MRTTSWPMRRRSTSPSCQRCDARSHCYIPQQRHVLEAAAVLDDVAAGREREMIAGHQRAVGRGAVEQLLARRDRLRAVDIELRLPIGMAREQRRMLRGIAQ